MLWRTEVYKVGQAEMFLQVAIAGAKPPQEEIARRLQQACANKPEATKTANCNPQITCSSDLTLKPTQRQQIFRTNLCDLYADKVGGWL